MEVLSIRLSMQSIVLQTLELENYQVTATAIFYIVSTYSGAPEEEGTFFIVKSTKLNYSADQSLAVKVLMASQQVYIFCFLDIISV